MLFHRWSICIAFLLTLRAGVAQGQQKKNVLFIVADDLRNELGCYGSIAQTPNIDKLADKGLLFQRAYCQQTLCNPSRSSFLTGLRPNTLRLWVNNVHFREHNPDVMTLPLWFKQHGYVTRDVGKIFHNWATKEHGDSRSWSAPEFLYFANHGNDKPQIEGPLPKNQSGMAQCERYDVPDNAYFDGRVAAEAVRVMQEVKDKPFFLAVGFWKPHTPFNSPHAYWSPYDQVKLPTIDLQRPAGSPEIAYLGLPGIPSKFNAAQVAEMRRGYLACTSYMDKQVGKVLAALEKQKLKDSTWIVFVSDHGFHVGEHGMWSKSSCFELDARVPLIIVPPGGKSKSSKTDALVELLDLFPTLTEMCGLPTPPGLEGRSLVPLLTKPDAPHKPAAFTQHPRPAFPERSKTGQIEAMGYSVRTADVRYTEWRDWTNGRLVARELYDHALDPAETKNVVDTPPSAAALSKAVSLLHAQFPPDQPPLKP